MTQSKVVTALSKLLNCVAADTTQQSHALIEETDPGAKLRSVRIEGLQAGVIVFTPDAGRTIKKGQPLALCPLFDNTGNADHNRACDAVILHEQPSGYCHIGYIELKSDSPSGFPGQFKSTRAFMRYLVALLHEFYDTKLEIKNERFVVLHTDSSGRTKSLKKKGSRYKPELPSSPSNPYKRIVRDGETLPWTHLV